MNSNITKGESLFAEGRIEEAEQIFLSIAEKDTESKGKLPGQVHMGHYF